MGVGSHSPDHMTATFLYHFPLTTLHKGGIYGRYHADIIAAWSS
jgi:hypothetical protein